MALGLQRPPASPRAWRGWPRARSVLPGLSEGTCRVELLLPAGCGESERGGDPACCSSVSPALPWGFVLCHRKMVQTHLAPSPPWPWDRRQTPFSRRQSGVRTGSRTCAPLSRGAVPGPARRGAGGRPGVHTHTGTFVCVFASACVERREFRDASGSGLGPWPPASFLFPRCSSFPTEAW